MKSKLVVGNWKMNGDLVRNQALLEQVSTRAPQAITCVVCVPFPYLAQAQALLSASAVGVGAQNVSEFEQGAYTGEVSAAILREFACRYVIVGHSERRSLLAESDESVARKAVAALREGLVPIVCVGESLAEREASQVEAVLARQLGALGTHLDRQALAQVVIAYEPVWAIGTGRTATPVQVQDVLCFLRGWLRERVDDPGSMKILYGGSVKPQGAEELFRLPDCDGGLIGGASLVADDFIQICEAAAIASQ